LIGNYKNEAYWIDRSIDDLPVEFIDENGGGPGVRLPQAAREEDLEFSPARHGAIGAGRPPMGIGKPVGFPRLAILHAISNHVIVNVRQ
jgi:hypothetical protein